MHLNRIHWWRRRVHCPMPFNIHLNIRTGQIQWISCISCRISLCQHRIGFTRRYMVAGQGPALEPPGLPSSQHLRGLDESRDETRDGVELDVAVDWPDACFCVSLRDYGTGGGHSSGLSARKRIMAYELGCSMMVSRLTGATGYSPYVPGHMPVFGPGRSRTWK
jgi:hypothetical protein